MVRTVCHIEPEPSLPEWVQVLLDFDSNLHILHHITRLHKLILRKSDKRPRYRIHGKERLSPTQALLQAVLELQHQSGVGWTRVVCLAACGVALSSHNYLWLGSHGIGIESWFALSAFLSFVPPISPICRPLPPDLPRWQQRRSNGLEAPCGKMLGLPKLAEPWNILEFSTNSTWNDRTAQQDPWHWSEIVCISIISNYV